MTWLDRVLATPCPKCGEPAGAKCMTPYVTGKALEVVCTSRIQAAEGASKPSRKHRFIRVVAHFGPHNRAVLECEACGAQVTTRNRKHIYSHDGGATWTPGPSACPGRRP